MWGYAAYGGGFTEQFCGVSVSYAFFRCRACVHGFTHGVALGDIQLSFCVFFFNADICVLTTEEGEPPPLCHSASTLQWWRNATLHPRPLPFKIRSFAWALRKCRSCWPASNSTRLAVQFVDFYPRNLKQASTWSPSFAQLGWPQCRRLTEYDTMLPQE